MPGARSARTKSSNPTRSKIRRHDQTRTLIRAFHEVDARAPTDTAILVDARCTDQNLTLLDGLQAPYESYMGVDWGGGKFAYTVVWIMAKDDKDRWRLIYVRKFDERDLMKQVEVIANLIPIFNVKQAVAGIGYGAVQVSELQKRFGSRVMG